MKQDANTLQKKSSGIALLPFLVFIVIYLGAGLYEQSKGTAMAFYQFPSVTAIFIATILAFFIGKGSINEKFSTFARGAGNENILIMLIIYLLAGAFSSVSKSMGGVDATVNMGVSVIPVQFLAAGVFVISAFLGIATGTSMGTIGAIVPIALGIANKAGLNTTLLMAACVGGAMFGDNLSMISDTTIAATRTQGCELRDKFKLNGLIALPAAVLTIVLLLIFGRPDTIVNMGSTSFSFIKVIPYLFVLIFALAGWNVFLVLTIGIFASGIIGMTSGDLTLMTFAQKVWSGFTDMGEVFCLSLFCGGLAELTTHNGGINWLISKISKMIRGQRSAQFGIAALVSLADIATANNTVAIIISGSISKDMSRQYKVDPRRSASLLDIFACIFQGFIPYGAQLLLVGSLSKGVVNPVQMIPLLWYQQLLLVFAVVSVFIPFADGVCRKNPWNWEYDVAESGVEEKKAILAKNKEAESAAATTAV